MVQNFTVFMDRFTTVKIKTTKISMGGEDDDVIVNERCANAPQLVSGDGCGRTNLKA